MTKQSRITPEIVAQLKSAHSAILGSEEIAQMELAYLILSGGGAKGVLYSGVLEALELSGAISSMRGIAGSSAGAITAGLIATGMDAKTFNEVTSKLDMPKLLGKGVGPILKDGAPLLAELRKNISQNIYNFLKDKSDEQIQVLASKRMSEVEQEQITNTEKLQREQTALQILTERDIQPAQKQLNNLSELTKDKTLSSLKKRQYASEHKALTQEIKRLNASATILKDSIAGLKYHDKELKETHATLEDISTGKNTEISELRAKSQDQKNPILFGDLEKMNRLAPKIFKGLHVTAVNQKTGDLTIFNSQTSPNVEIALACKASASLPIITKPTKVAGEKYVDGGYRDNLPFKAFKKAALQAKTHDAENIINDRNKIMDARAKGQTLAFAFDNSDARMAAYNAGKNLYEPGRITKFLMNIALKTLAKVGGKWKYTDMERDTLHQVRDNAMNTVLLNPKSVGTIDFAKAQKNQKQLHATGYLQTMEHLENFKNNGPSKEPQLALKIAMLEIYDNINTTQQRSFWQNKVSGMNNHKDMLLDFSMPKKWDKEPIDMIKEYVMIAAISPAKKNIASPDARSVDSMLKVLNSKTTSNHVKKEFAKALETHNDGLKKPFTKQDIQKFIEKNPELAQSCKAKIEIQHAQQKAGQGR